MNSFAKKRIVQGKKMFGEKTDSILETEEGECVYRRESLTM